MKTLLIVYHTGGVKTAQMAAGLAADILQKCATRALRSRYTCLAVQPLRRLQ